MTDSLNEQQKSAIEQIENIDEVFLKVIELIF